MEKFWEYDIPKRVPELSPSTVKNARPRTSAWKLVDGKGLFLLVLPDGAKQWRFKYRRPDTGKENLLALGNYPDVSLSKARERRAELRALLADGIDPGEQRKANIANGPQQVNNGMLRAEIEGCARICRVAKLMRPYLEVLA